ncbi:hypothetical protein EX30DRAFT_126322 [Ascodesmis nigricans]|uniref:Uncharacterized protein n=1 Tax=Ascodesmis nigricans TaxID=341454 RepID=A0A4V3SI66_9PEZI|nr:hypothetical protein EX30DRAFT_126322 [Ascodesmis nigricans]
MFALMSMALGFPTDCFSGLFCKASVSSVFSYRLGLFSHLVLRFFGDGLVWCIYFCFRVSIPHFPFLGPRRNGISLTAMLEGILVARRVYMCL